MGRFKFFDLFSKIEIVSFIIIASITFLLFSFSLENNSIESKQEIETTHGNIEENISNIYSSNLESMANSIVDYLKLNNFELDHQFYLKYKPYVTSIVRQRSGEKDSIIYKDENFSISSIFERGIHFSSSILKLDNGFYYKKKFINSGNTVSILINLDTLFRVVKERLGGLGYDIDLLLASGYYLYKNGKDIKYKTINENPELKEISRKVMYTEKGSDKSSNNHMTGWFQFKLFDTECITMATISQLNLDMTHVESQNFKIKYYLGFFILLTIIIIAYIIKRVNYLNKYTHLENLYDKNRGKLNRFETELKDRDEQNRFMKSELSSLSKVYDSILANMNEAVLIEDKDGIIKYSNPVFNKFMEIDQDYSVGKHWSQFVTDENLHVVKSIINKRGYAKTSEYKTTLHSISGVKREVLVKTSPVIVDDKVTAQLNIITDISEKESVRNEILKLNNFLNYIIDNASVWINVLDSENKLLLWNKAAEEISGYSRAEVLGKNGVTSKIYPDRSYRAFITSQVENKIQNQGIISNLETDIVTKSGDIRTISWYSKKINHSDDGYNGSISMGIDITDKKRAEKRNIEHIEFQTNILNAIKTFNSSLDMEKIYNFVADQVKQVLNCTKVKIVKYDSESGNFLIRVGNDREETDIYENQYLEKVVKDQSYYLDNDSMRLLFPLKENDKVSRILVADKDGSTFTEKEITLLDNILNFAALAFTNGNLFKKLKREVKSREEAEKKLLLSSKMELLGSIATGVAHDINNSLIGITATASILQAHIEKSPDKPIKSFTEHINRVINSADSLRDTTDQIVDITKTNMSNKNKPTNLKKVLHKLADLCKISFDKSVKISVEYPKEDTYSTLNKGLLTQALLNICKNSVEAMTSMRKDQNYGGDLKLIMKPITAGEHFKRNNPEAVEDNYWEIEISDNGVGMEESVLKKIFQPYFTTKSENEGTGIGLFSVRSTIKKFGGFIQVFSKKGVGTSSKIYLPVTEVDVEKLPSSHSEDSKLVNREGVILIVDDEISVTESLKGILKEFGFDVIVAQNGKSGVEKYRQWYRAIDIAIIDLNMPDIDGRETYLKMLEISDEPNFIITSGFSQDKRVNELRELGVKSFLPKPYSMVEVNNVITKLLEDNNLL